MVDNLNNDDVILITMTSLKMMVISF